MRRKCVSCYIKLGLSVSQRMLQDTFVMLSIVNVTCNCNLNVDFPLNYITPCTHFARLKSWVLFLHFFSHCVFNWQDYSVLVKENRVLDINLPTWACSVKIIDILLHKVGNKNVAFRYAVSYLRYMNVFKWIIIWSHWYSSKLESK